MEKFNYEKMVYDEIMKYPVGEPIFLKDIINSIVVKTGCLFRTVRLNVAVMMGRIIKAGVKVKRFKKGIYYRYEICVFGETVIHRERLLFKKYLVGGIGYEIGPKLLNALGFTTLLSNLPRTFVSNVASVRSFYDKDLNVNIVKPKAMLTVNNFRYFQFFDVILMLGTVPVDHHEPLAILQKFIGFYGLRFDVLFYYGMKYYKKDVLDVVMRLFGRTLEGGCV